MIEQRIAHAIVAGIQDFEGAPKPAPTKRPPAVPAWFTVGLAISFIAVTWTHFVDARFAHTKIAPRATSAPCRDRFPGAPCDAP